MRTRDLGLLALRLGVGGAVAAHGAQKLLGWFGGPGPENTAAWFRQIGIPRPEASVRASSACELGGGLLLAAGLATPAAGAAVLGNMRVAADTHKEHGFFATEGGYELPVTYGLVAGALALTGPGRLSFDGLLGDRLARPWMGLAGIAAAVAIGTLIARARQPEQAGEGEADEEVVDVSDDALAVAERAEGEVAQTPV